MAPSLANHQVAVLGGGCFWCLDAVFRGLEGFGETAEIHRSHLLAHDQPIVITIVDSDDRLRDLIPAIEGMMDTGMIAMSDVQVTRIQNSVAARDV